MDAGDGEINNSLVLRLTKPGYEVGIVCMAPGLTTIATQSSSTVQSLSTLQHCVVQWCSKQYLLSLMALRQSES